MLLVCCRLSEFVVHCLTIVLCGLLRVVRRCSLFLVRCLLFVVCCLFFVARGVLFVV